MWLPLLPLPPPLSATFSSWRLLQVMTSALRATAVWSTPTAWTWRREAAACAGMASARCGTITPTAKVRRRSDSRVSSAVAVRAGVRKKNLFIYLYLPPQSWHSPFYFFIYLLFFAFSAAMVIWFQNESIISSCYGAECGLVWSKLKEPYYPHHKRTRRPKRKQNIPE